MCQGIERCDLSNLGAVGDIFGGVNALFAALALGAAAYSADSTRKAYQEERQRNHDVEYVSQVRMSYEWAYNALTDDGGKMPPRPDRLNWLTAARHLVRAESIAKQVESVAYRAILEEHTEYWRLQFYRALNMTANTAVDYLKRPVDETGVKVGLGVDLDSAMIVSRFMSWKEEVIDPLTTVDRATLEAFTRGQSGGIFFGLNRHLDQIADGKRACEATLYQDTCLEAKLKELDS